MPRIKASGINELKAALRNNANVDDVKAVVRLNTSEMHSKAQRNAAVDTGEMRRGIEQNIKDAGLTGEVDSTADYSHYVEYGTVFMAAQPFIRPAFHAQKHLFISDMQRLVK